ncbi:family 20 glycosylhydrolase [Flagellimonas meishanensis]|uniref:family 20 glycosylhydrolase n=1 Tax=Flagellimonas meishanensis TaxID=2873264 RepID=UPI001CA66FAC|nr:family 20 glycosylhydrolase [[Muricauda] meishanensis]
MFKKVFAVSLLLIVAAACQPKKKEILYPKTDLSQAPLIPKPINTVATHSAFGLDQNTVILTSESDPGFEQVGRFLSDKIKWQTGLEVPVNQTAEENSIHRFIYINKANSQDLKTPESYQLYIKNDSIFVNSESVEGAFRGIQTLRQLIPEKSNDTLTDHPLWVIPSGKIVDAPKFAFRGAMLDVARHFFTVEEVKKYIDILAYYKYNKFHLHLSDDQGWRIEIKSWPKLTTVGGATEVGGGKGGFYTQEEYKELVNYAAERHITIIPEIDMPGHTNAASVSYPFLNGNGKTLKPYTGTRVGFSTFDANKDSVYIFLDDVIREIASISPGPYFHIGGDESHVTPKKDYIHFVERVEKIVQKHGKSMIGWNEIAQADISPSSVVQLWNEKKHAQIAAQNGSKIILSPAEKIYLDMKYDSLSTYGLNWAGLIPVDTAYNWDPETYVEDLPIESILGIEAPLWSETISNSAELEYLAFPRAIGYGELGWSLREHCDWEDYRTRLRQHVPYLERMQVNYYPTTLVDWDK